MSFRHRPLMTAVYEWHFSHACTIPVNPPPFRGSLPRKSLISRMEWVSCAGDINLPHDLPPTTKIKYSLFGDSENRENNYLKIRDLLSIALFNILGTHYVIHI